MHAMRIVRILTPIALAALPLARVFAAGPPAQLVPLCNNGQGGVKGVCGLCDLVALANNVINLGIFLAVFFAAVLFAYAGWQYMTARGDPAQIGKAHNIFGDVAIGFIIVLAAWLVVDTIMHVLTSTQFGDDWSKIC